MKKLILSLMLFVSTLVGAQTFPVNNLQVNGQAGGNVCTTVTNVSALRAIVRATANTKAVCTTGYYTDGDGGGNQYFVKSTTSSGYTDDGCYTFIAGDGTVWRPVTSNLNVKQCGAHVDGVTDDSSYIQNAVNALANVASPSVLDFTAGTSIVANQVTLKNGITYRGKGIGQSGGSVLKCTTTTDCFVIKNTLNGSTAASIQIENLYFYSTTLTQYSGLLFDTASSYLVIRHCNFYTSGTGVIFDQTEISDIYDSQFNMNASGAAGLWLVNGTQKNTGSLTYYTNRIGVHSSQFNGGAGNVGIYDDGGTSHVYENNNFNAMQYHIVATGVNGLRITGGENEVASSSSIVLGTTKRDSSAGAATVVANIDNVFLFSNTSAPVITAAASSVTNLTLTNNVFNTTVNPFSGLSNAVSIQAYNNLQVGTDSSGIALNNFIDNAATTYQWNASTVTPSLGNGTVSASYSRKGKLVTYRLKLTTGSTTTLGTGSYTFALPTTLLADVSLTQSYTGSGFILVAGSSYYPAVSRITTDGASVSLYVVNGNAVGASVPAAFPSGSIIEFEIQYATTSPI